MDARGYRFALELSPNRAAVAGTLVIELTKATRPVTGARVAFTVFMLDMDMGQQLMGALRETAPGRYVLRVPALGMVGRWGVRLAVTPPRSGRFDVTMIDLIDS
jgi:hypothetical protein